MAISKVKLPDNRSQDIHDARITGVDSTPTTGSENVITSGGVYNALSGKEDVSNKVTSLSSSSTDTQYPSAKCVYGLIGDIESVLDAIINGTNNS